MNKQYMISKRKTMSDDNILIFQDENNINITLYNNIMPLYKQIDHNQTKKLTDLDLLIYDCIINNKSIDCIQNSCEEYTSEYINERTNTLNKYITTLKDLKKIPLIKQRTTEWFDARKTRLTASELEDAIRDKSLKLAKKKANVVQDNTNYNAIPALKWGTMFEDMASRCYSQQRNDISIFEFGLILDKNHPHFGASPDGINGLGIMIEIKCPFSREIKDGYIPSKYYMQMQGQLAVCQLNECDYIECQFITYDSVYKYIDEIESIYGNIVINHGIIAEYRNIEEGNFKYLYSNPYLKASKAYDDINKQINDFQDNKYEFSKLTAWRLEKMNVQRVYFDENLWEKTRTLITDFWQKVEDCKNMPIEIEEKTKKARKKIEFIDDD